MHQLLIQVRVHIPEQAAYQLPRQEPLAVPREWAN
jgi:hypothetical protein